LSVHKCTAGKVNTLVNHENTTIAKCILVQQNLQAEEEDNVSNIRNTRHEHDPKAHVLRRGRGGRDIVIFVSFIFV